MNFSCSRPVLTLTSHPPRFATLAASVTTLLNQSVKPAEACLFLTPEHCSHLPRNVLDLQSSGLSIVESPDLRSYQKLVPALIHYSDRLIVTADDDILYEKDWLASLIAGYSHNTGCVICHRAHRIRALSSFELAPYLSWVRDVQDDNARRPCADILPTGVGGILYPPGCFDRMVTNRELFMSLCPTGDDLWFYWMFRSAGTRAVKVGSRFKCNYVAGSQEVALWPENRELRNDQMIRNLVETFGFPF